MLRTLVCVWNVGPLTCMLLAIVTRFCYWKPKSWRYKLCLKLALIAIMNISNAYVVPRLTYDSCQINQLSHGKIWKCIDSIEMNRRKLNMPINAIMLPSRNRLNQVKRMTKMIQWNQSINSIYILTFLRNLKFRWLFWKAFYFVNFLKNILSLFNWFNQSSPLYSIDSVTFYMKTNWASHESTHLEKELNQFNQFCGKNESIQINQLSRLDWYTSLVVPNFSYPLAVRLLPLS